MASSGHGCVPETPPTQRLPGVLTAGVPAQEQQQFPHIDLPAKPPPRAPPAPERTAAERSAWYERLVQLKVIKNELARRHAQSHVLPPTSTTPCAGAVAREPPLPPAAPASGGSPQSKTVVQGSAGAASAGWIKKKKARVYRPLPLATRPRGC